MALITLTVILVTCNQSVSTATTPAQPTPESPSSQHTPAPALREREKIRRVERSENNNTKMMISDRENIDHKRCQTEENINKNRL